MEKELSDRALAFHMLKLPGQPGFMHMGTSLLVHDLQIEIASLEAEIERMKEIIECVEIIANGVGLITYDSIAEIKRIRPSALAAAEKDTE